MPRRPPPAEDDVSLFPFLSIIACVIGVLTMMIATTALSQTDNEAVSRIEAYEDYERQLIAANLQIDQLNQRVESSQLSIVESRQAEKELDATIAELDTLAAELELIDSELADQRKIEIMIPPATNESREQLADVQAEYEQLQRDIAQLEIELTNRVEAAEARVTILPQGTGLRFVPHFIECASGSIVLHDVVPPKRIRLNEASEDEDFLATLSSAFNGVDDSIVFLLRSDGLASYQHCRRICEGRQIRNGKLPVVGRGKIDLSAFVAPAKPTGSEP